jgi:hypothetical protein
VVDGDPDEGLELAQAHLDEVVVPVGGPAGQLDLEPVDPAADLAVELAHPPLLLPPRRRPGVRRDPRSTGPPW